MDVRIVDPSDERGYFTLDDLLEDIENINTLWYNRILDRGFPNGIANYRPSYAITHPWVIVKFWISHIKWAWQRVFRGWDDRAVWSIDTYLSKHIVQLVSELKSIDFGVPHSMWEGMSPVDNNYNYSEEDDEIAQKRWENVLTSIVEGFQILANDGACKPLSKEEIERVDLAWELLKRHYKNLWW